MRRSSIIRVAGAALILSCTCAHAELAHKPNPFPAPDDLWAEVIAMIGQDCGGLPGAHISRPGFTLIKGFLPLIYNYGLTIVPMEKAGVRFAFLTQLMDKATICKIRDVVTLPSAGQANALLQCSIDKIGSGPGLRFAGRKAVVAFWTVDFANAKFVRQPMEIINHNKIRCQEPETAE
jgi:hypothetical protein